MRSFLGFACVLAAVASHAEPLATHCVSSTDANLANATWLGKRYGVTWYAPGGKAVPPPPSSRPKAPGKPQPVLRAAPEPEPGPPPLQAPVLQAAPQPDPGPPPPPTRALEVFFALAEPAGELVGGSTREVSPLDGASSVMPVLTPGAGKLGLSFMDDGTGARMAAFRLLELDGRPASDTVRVPAEHLPHGDQSALAWNAKVEQWGLVFQGTEPTSTPGHVTHHLYGTRFRGSAPGTPTRLDADGSITSAHNLALVPSGSCFVTAWANEKQEVVWAQWCGDAVKRVPIRSGGRSPMQVTVSATDGGQFLVAWVDHASLAPPASVASPGGATGAAPSAPPRKVPTGLASLPRLTVFFALLNASGSVVKTGALDAGGYAQGPGVLADASGFWVAWNEQDDAGNRVLAARLDAQGVVARRLEATPVPGPVWVSLARGNDGAALVVSQGNATDCKVAWATLR